MNILGQSKGSLALNEAYQIIGSLYGERADKFTLGEIMWLVDDATHFRISNDENSLYFLERVKELQNRVKERI